MSYRPANRNGPLLKLPCYTANGVCALPQVPNPPDDRKSMPAPATHVAGACGRSGIDASSYGVRTALISANPPCSVQLW
jgi:hypothetical protein